MTTPGRGRVLVVEDEPVAGEVVRMTFDLDGYDVAVCTTGESAVNHLREHGADLVVADLGLPGLSGLDLVRAINEASPAGVIIVSGIDSEPARVRALEVGADDFIVKPASPPELLARAHALMRRTSAAGRRESVVTVGDRLAIDLESREVRVHGAPVELTAKEFDLLAFLATHPGKVFTRHQLLVGVWHSAAEWQAEATVTEHVRRLRSKLGDDAAQPELLLTVRGVGYRFDRRTPPRDADAAA